MATNRQASGRNPSPLPPRRMSRTEGADLMQAREAAPPKAAAGSGASGGTAGPTSNTTEPGLSSPPGLSRRPRAGTMPSNLHLDRPDGLRRQLSNIGLGGAAAGAGASASVGTSGTSSPNPEAIAIRSAYMRNPGGLSSVDLMTAALRAGAAERHQRLRSGSLTALASSSSAAAGLSSPFGASVFGGAGGGSWTPRSSIAGNRIPEELRSMHSSDSYASSLAGDDAHIRTLDYLGLDDSPVGGGGFATPFSAGANIGSFGALPGSLSRVLGLGGGGGGGGGIDSLGVPGTTGRLRSNTVAGMPRRDFLPPPRRTSPFHVPSMDNLREKVAEEEDENLMEGEDDGSGGGDYVGTSPGIPRKGSLAPESPRLLHSSSLRSLNSDSSEAGSGLLNATSPTRPRASTIGMAALEDGSQIMARRRAGTTSGITPRLLDVGMAAAAPPNLLTPTPPDSRTRKGDEVSGGGSRPITPETRSLTPPPQQPSRSLWIGNLDPSTSAQELMQVFAPYGAIESLRLLPEKECGFVNFVSINDAIHAKEDVLNRLGGQILSKYPSMVRIGFGKAESAPATPARGLDHNRAPSGPMVASPDSNLQTAPTRALWVGSIPSHTTPSELLKIFSPYGPIESARVLTHKNCGFVNFERLDDAVCARKALNGREILGQDVGAVRIGFAKVPNKIMSGVYSPGGTVGSPEALLGSPSSSAYYALRQIRGAASVPIEQQILSGAMENYRSNLVMGLMGKGGKGVKAGVSRSGKALQNVTGAEAGANEMASLSDVTSAPAPSVTDMQLLMKELAGGDESELELNMEAVKEFRPPVTYYTSIPPPQADDGHSGKRFSVSDAPRLREIRKRLDSGSMSQAEVGGVAVDLLEECVVLSSDYIGNTLIQKFFERCSTEVKLKLLERIAPHLASIGCHKNGTWAAQKIIDCANTPEEISLICQNLKPYTPPLLLDQYGNYVVQCTLRFGSPACDFVFDAMIDRCWEIGQGRFGARSMRTCLENSIIGKLQVKRVAIAIILNSIPLATNPNGALLLTWLLDTSNLSGRYRLLAPRLAPHLSHLCTHKLASLTVLRLINQKADPDAAQTVLKGLFGTSPQVLEDVLGDQVHGVTVIQKILASNYIDAAEKQAIGEKVKASLSTLRVQQVPAYKRIVEDLGMPYGGGSPAPSNLYPKTPPQYQRSPSWPSPHSQASGFSPYQSNGEYPSFMNAMGQLSPSNRQNSSPSFSPSGMPMGLPMGGSPLMAGTPLARHGSPLPGGMMMPPMPGGGSPWAAPGPYAPMGSPDPFQGPYNLRMGEGDFNFQMMAGGSPPPPAHPGMGRSHSGYFQPPLRG